jgi:predicted ribosomally synthesized peptide with SipW-like signal peptide
MTDDDSAALNISRRKTLAALGTIGVASAGAGLGTSAYFSDQETFQNNSLMAGELDLKVDWEEHYSDWSSDEEVGEDGDVTMLDIGEDPPTGARAFPTCASNDVPRVAVANDQVANFMRATAVEAAPDVDGDNLADGGVYDLVNDESNQPWEIIPCEDYPDPDDLGRPLIALDDVKPGDFGEVTFSLHLCDNPGYLWANAMNIEWAENGHTEPEADDPQSVGPADEEGSTADGDSLEDAQVELLETLQACLFYDDGNNLYDTAQNNPACISFVLDDSGSMAGTKAQQTRDGAKAVINDLDFDDDGDIDPHQAAVTTFGSGANLQQALTNDVGDLETAIDEVDGDAGLTNIDDAIGIAGDELAECPDDVDTIMVILSNGAENIGDARDAAQDEVDDGNVDTFFTIGVQAGTAGDDLLQDIADLSPSENGVFLDVTDPDQITGAFGQLVQTIGGDTEIVSGSLRDVLMALMADPSAGDWGLGLDAFPETEGRDCFVNSSDVYLGLEWWLPVDHGNEVQGDSVEFDLGFYTEQCRHNDGEGMNSETVDGEA